MLVVMLWQSLSSQTQPLRCFEILTAACCWALIAACRQVDSWSFWCGGVYGTGQRVTSTKTPTPIFQKFADFRLASKCLHHSTQAWKTVEKVCDTAETGRSPT